MSFPTGATAILLFVCILSLLSTKCPAQKIAPDSRIIKSERYSFVCVLRVEWLPGLDTPMQPPRHRVRFPAASILRKGGLHRHLPKPRQAHHSRGLCCSPSLLRLTLRSPVYIWVCNCNNGRGLTSAAGRRVSPRFQYGVQSLSGYRFCLIGPYAAARFDKRQKSFSIQVPSSVMPDFPECRQQKSHTAITR